MAAYDRVWSAAVVEGDTKLVFVGRESGALEKHDAASIGSDNKPAQLTLTGHQGAVTGILAASGDEATTCSADGTLRVWNTAAEVEGKREGKVTTLPAPARCMIASGEATYVGLSSGAVVKVEGGAVAATLGGLCEPVAALAVSETAIFAASYDGTVRAWDLASGAPQFVFRGHSTHAKGLAVVNGTHLVTVARDDTCMVWAIPAEGPQAAAAAAEGGDAGDAPAEGEGGAEGGASPAAAAAEPEAIVVSPIGVIDLPATPHVLTPLGTQLCIGCSDGSVLGLATKALLKAVADYAANIDASCAAATRSINKNTSIKVANAKKIAKRKIKAAKAKIAAEEAEAAGSAAPPAAAAPAEGEEEAEVAEAAEAEEGEEGASGPALSEAGQKRLEEETAAINAEAEAAIAAANASKAEQVAKLAPLKQQRYTQRREQFATCPFATTFKRAGREPVLTLVADGAALAYAAAGNSLVPVPARVGVQAL